LQVFENAFPQLCREWHAQILQEARKCMEEDLQILAKTIKDLRQGDENIIPRCCPCLVIS
jgi:hypothetical protein